MTQAMNLANFANSLDSSGGVPPSQLNAPVPISKGGTNASTAPTARANLGSTTIGDAVFIATDTAAAQTAIGTVIGTDVPSPTGTGASGTWDINITGNADTATAADSATTAGSVTGIVAVVNGGTGTSSGIPTNVQLFTTTGTWTKPTAGQSMAFIELWGGGGSGGGGQYSTTGGGCGGGGGYTFVTVSLSELPSSFTATVGAGGATTANGTNGNAGGTSSIPTAIYGRNISASGGRGGLFASGSGAGGAGLISGTAGSSTSSGSGGSSAQGILGGIGGAGSGSNLGGGGGGGYANGANAGSILPGGGSTGGAGGTGAVRITCY